MPPPTGKSLKKALALVESGLYSLKPLKKYPIKDENDLKIQARK
jgi:hypothetical protein